MYVQGTIPLFGQVLGFVKAIEFYYESSEVQYSGITSTIIDISRSICKTDLICRKEAPTEDQKDWKNVSWYKIFIYMIKNKSRKR